MKIKISFLPEETKAALDALEALRILLPTAKIRKSDAHSPFKHVYLTNSIKKGCNSVKKVV